MEPEISVIMSVFNSESKKKLSNSIESILHQTFTNFEFIICDDGSNKDFVKEVLNYESKKDKRIKLIKNERNSGLAFSLNECLKQSKGAFIARQDDDDVSTPDRFEKEISFLKSNPRFGFIGCNLWLYDENGIYGKRDLLPYPSKYNLLFGCPFAHPSLLMRKTSLDKVGWYTISPRIRRTEDYDLYFKFCFYGIKGANLTERLYIYSETSYTLKKQKFKYRVYEFFLRVKWFAKLEMPFFKGIFYSIKPLISGIIPKFVREKLKRNKAYCVKEKLLIANDRFKNIHLVPVNCWSHV